MTEQDAMLEEYKVLHAQAEAIKGRRDSLFTVTLGVFVSVFGAFVGISSAPDTHSAAPRLLLPFFLVLYILHIASCLLMRSHQQQLRRILNYVRIEIEPKIPGLKWSTYLAQRSLKSSNRGGLRGIGTFYLLLSMAPIALFVITPGTPGGVETTIFVTLFAVSVLLAMDIRFAFTKGWRDDAR